MSKPHECNMLHGNHKGMTQLERSRSRWDISIKLDFKEKNVGFWTGFNWFRHVSVVRSCTLQRNF